MEQAERSKFEGTVRRVQVKTGGRGKQYAVIAAPLKPREWVRIIALGSLGTVAANLKAGDRIFAKGDTRAATVADGQIVHTMTAETLAPVRTASVPARTNGAPDLAEQIRRAYWNEGVKAYERLVKHITEKYGEQVKNETIREAIRRAEAEDGPPQKASLSMSATLTFRLGHWPTKDFRLGGVVAVSGPRRG